MKITMKFPWKNLVAFEPIALAVALALPWVIPAEIGDQTTVILIYAVLALGLNVVLGSAGILHLGIAAFFAIGAYIAGILTVGTFPFQTGFTIAFVAATIGTALAGLVLGLPTLRLRGDYLALVTLGFGEVVRYSLRNFEQITGGSQSLSRVPRPEWFGIDWNDFRPFYYLCLAILVAVVLLLRNLERSRLGRAWNAIREDELAATCMGINATQVKLLAFSIGAALAGLAGCLYASKLGSTAAPDDYSFSVSVQILCCVILGGMGSIRGVLVGVVLLVGYDVVVTRELDNWLQKGLLRDVDNPLLRFTTWKLLIFGLVLILMMRFRPEGLLPSKRMQRELHREKSGGHSIWSEESMF
jgi:branched-chain amino acid transport system permease protein